MNIRKVTTGKTLISCIIPLSERHTGIQSALFRMKGKQIDLLLYFVNYDSKHPDTYFYLITELMLLVP